MRESFNELGRPTGSKYSRGTSITGGRLNASRLISGTGIAVGSSCKLSVESVLCVSLSPESSSSVRRLG